MKLVVITHTPHWQSQDGLLAYAPYVREMNLWFKHCHEISVVAPLAQGQSSAIHAAYHQKDVRLRKVPSFSLLRFRESVKTIFKAPYIAYVIYSEMRKADHIHLRCPGNMGLLGAVVQVFFPSKKKTVKYAGNWDPNSKQPLSYRLQKRIISNTTLSKNLKVLVYGKWPEQSSNVFPFFTASYHEKDKVQTVKKMEMPYRFMFVGSLVTGKRPEYAINLVKCLRAKGIEVTLDMYGDGNLKETLLLEATDYITMHGNQDAATVRQAYQDSHFLILASKSEGWPKVVAEAMFYGTIPLVTPISCVPWMLDYGNRGQLLSLDLEKDSEKLQLLLDNKERCAQISRQAQDWSQQYTLNSFEQAIQKLLV